MFLGLCGLESHTYPLLSLGEEEISFPPTYRYERGSRDTYAWHKQKPTGVSGKNGVGFEGSPGLQ